MDDSSLIYRYSVKCSRERFAAIERAAKAAGQSAAAFVQAHFETILEAKAEPLARKQPDAALRSDLDVMVNHRLTAGATRLFKAICACADEQGECAVSHDVLAWKALIAPKSVSVLVSSLIAAGLIIRIGRTASGAPPRFGVMTSERLGDGGQP